MAGFARKVLRGGNRLDDESHPIKDVVEQHRGASLRRRFGPRVRQLPETRDRSLEDIERQLISDRRERANAV